MAPNRYEIVLKVADTGNITRAAEALNYTQSGVSHAVAAVEKETGVVLFSRSHAGVAPTKNGAVILRAIRELVRQQREYEQVVYSVKHVVAGRLRLGFFSSIALRHLPPLLTKFQAQYPAVEVDLLDGNYDELAAWLLSGEIDCTFLSRSVTRPEMQFHSLLRDSIVAVMAADDPLARGSSITLPELRTRPLIYQSKGCDNDMQMLLGKELADCEVRCVLQDDLSVLSFVAEGFGVALLPKMIPDALLQTESGKRIRVLPMEPPVQREIGIAALPPSRQTLVTKVFMEFAEAELRSE